MTFIVALASSVASASAANAQDGDKNVNTAVAISIVSTAVPVAIAVLGGTGDRSFNPRLIGAAGMLFGPALGYAYANERSGLRGMYFRAGTLTMALSISAVAATSCAFSSSASARHGNCGWRTGAQVAGAAVMLASDIYDICNLPRAMRYGREETNRITVYPTFALDGRSTGVAVRVSF